jgi:hypothetical protein
MKSDAHRRVVLRLPAQESYDVRHEALHASMGRTAATLDLGMLRTRHGDGGLKTGLFHGEMYVSLARG